MSNNIIQAASNLFFIIFNHEPQKLFFQLRDNSLLSSLSDSMSIGLKSSLKVLMFILTKQSEHIGLFIRVGLC